MGKIIIEIPDQVAEALRLPPREASARILQELAVRLYEKGILTYGKARELVGLTWWEFHEMLAREGIPHSYDREELEADLTTLEKLK